MSGIEGVPPRKVYFVNEAHVFLEEFRGKLKTIRDSFFNRDPPAIETDKMRGFNDWGPDSQKLIENLENTFRQSAWRGNVPYVTAEAMESEES